MSELKMLEVIERDDGKWALGWHDDPPDPFASRTFALTVGGHVSPASAPIAKFRRFKIIREVQHDASA